MVPQEADLSWIAVILILSMMLFTCGIIYLFMRYQLKKNTLIKEKQTLEHYFNQQLLQSQLEIQEQTFNIISQEIHDNVGQALSLAKMQLNILERGETLNKALITDTQDSISKAIADLRDIAKSLSTERIQQLNLSETINYELARINRLDLMVTSLQVEGREQCIQSKKKLIIFRIIQEALQNILKHAKASSINVRFKYAEDFLTIEVADNGKGFDKNLVVEKDGLGLRNIVDRAALIGGEANITSTLNKGTTVTIVAPYE